MTFIHSIVLGSKTFPVKLELLRDGNVRYSARRNHINTIIVPIYKLQRAKYCTFVMCCDSYNKLDASIIALNFHKFRKIVSNSKFCSDFLAKSKSHIVSLD